MFAVLEICWCLSFVLGARWRFVMIWGCLILDGVWRGGDLGVPMSSIILTDVPYGIVQHWWVSVKPTNFLLMMS
jgi:hypothetical protein